MFSFLNPAARTAQMTPTEAVARAARGEITLLDVREHAEVAATGRAKGALHVPLALLPMRADPRHPDYKPTLVQGKPIAVYCASGARSARAAQILAGLGYGDVVNIGGLGDWRAAGGAISR